MRLTENNIENFIANNKDENIYVDFKEKFNDNNARLIHDVLCMANADHSGDRYILFGVEDKTGKVIGVQNNKYRKNTEKFINLLTNTKINTMPKLDVYTVSIRGLEIDIMQISNLP